MSAPVIKAGLKFKSTTFSAEAEIMSVSEADNKCDVMLTPSDGHAWVANGWNLQHVKRAFERGDYTVIKPNPINISII